jgi:hypothetical protein
MRVQKDVAAYAHAVLPPEVLRTLTEVSRHCCLLFAICVLRYRHT